MSITTFFVTVIVTLSVTIEHEEIAKLQTWKPAQVSEIIITGVVRIGGTMKKMLVSTVLSVLLAVVLASAALAAPATARERTYFMGSLRATEHNTIDPASMRMYVNSSGAGNSTYLGRFTVSYKLTVNLQTREGSIASAIFVAENGDSLYAIGRGQGAETEDPDVTLVKEYYTITGGTGRYTNASGSFTVKRLVSRSTGLTTGSFFGHIVLSEE